MLYVPANDGMLHALYAGVNSADPQAGKEAWAFIPTAVLPNLYKLADTYYKNHHEFFVDGTPVVADAYNGAAWKTILVAGLNGGGDVIILGSLPRATEFDLSALRSVLRVVPVEVDALALAHGGARAGRVIDDAATAVVRALRVGADTALFAGGSAPTLGGLPARIAASLAGVARRALSDARAGGVVLTGGHTARAVCDALEIARIDLVGEIEPGVALGRAVGTAFDVVAKAGSFGDRLSLARALGRGAARRDAA